MVLFQGGIGNAAAQYTTESGPSRVDLGGGRVAGWASIESMKHDPKSVPAAVRDAVSAHTGGYQVVPLSAFGCSGDVCIDLDGDSTLVVSWGTQAFGNAGCQNAFFEYPADTYVGPIVCPDASGDGVYYDYTGPTGYFPDGAKLCNSWDHSSGRACKYIEL